MQRYFVCALYLSPSPKSIGPLELISLPEDVRFHSSKPQNKCINYTSIQVMISKDEDVSIGNITGFFSVSHNRQSKVVRTQIFNVFHC